MVVLAAMELAGCSKPKSTPISQAEVVRRTQELYDGVTAGNQEPWKKYVADDVLYFDEKGRDMNKTALVADVTPLPQGYSGEIKVVNSKFNRVGNTILHSFDEDEKETVFGQEMHAKYHETDTWMERNGQWQIVAGQVLRYYEDPAAGSAEMRKFRDYAGTYELGGEKAQVTAEGDKLYWVRGSKPKVEMIAESGDVFFRKGVEGRRIFHYSHGKVDAMIDRRNNEDILWKKVAGAR